MVVEFYLSPFLRNIYIVVDISFIMEKIRCDLQFGKNNIVITKEVKKFGDGGHIVMPRRYRGRQCVIIISETEFEEVVVEKK